MVDVGGGVGTFLQDTQQLHFNTILGVVTDTVCCLSVGGFPLQLLPVYPKLKFIVQDRPENVERGEKRVYPLEAPEAISSGRVKFMAHDFFNPNPIKNAEVYWLRGILYAPSSP